MQGHVPVPTTQENPMARIARLSEGVSRHADLRGTVVARLRAPSG